MKTPVAVSYEPIMVGAAEAAALCGTSRSNWLAWDAVGLTPRSIHINSRVLWAVETLREWARAGCPSREQFEVGRAALMEGRT